MDLDAASLRFQVRVMLHEVLFQCQAWDNAATGRRAAWGRRETDSSWKDDFWFAVQSQLSAAACISKLCWPSGKERSSYKQVRQAIRDVLELDDTSPLIARDVRNDLEHIDERLLDHMKTSAFVFARFIMPAPTEGSHVGTVFRLWDPQDETVHFFENKVSVPELEVEIHRLRPLAQTFVDTL